MCNYNSSKFFFSVLDLKFSKDSIPQELVTFVQNVETLDTSSLFDIDVQIKIEYKGENVESRMKRELEREKIKIRRIVAKKLRLI